MNDIFRNINFLRSKAPAPGWLIKKVKFKKYS